MAFAMTDVFTRQERSAVMSRIKGKDNKTTEVAFIILLKANSIKGWRRQWPVAGRPDVAFPKEKIAVFVDGCFWHQCPRHRKIPESNRSYWMEKFRAGKAKRLKDKRLLRAGGWTVLEVWEHDLKDDAGKANVLGRVHEVLSVGHERRMG